VRPRATATAATSLLLVGIGVAVLVESAVVGAGSVGWLLGVLFVVAGAGRLYLSTR
jgi:uncharacterized membrane protein HdeD (DUF308 family)